MTGPQNGSGPVVASGAAPVITIPPSEDPLVGRTLADRYLVLAKLGEGGMGSVYRARHVTLEKELALKVLHPEYARKPDLVERFLQEARAASRIRHENVIDITDFGALPEGLVFFAMEMLQGHDLSTELSRLKLEGHRMPWTRAAPIFLQVASALHAAHRHGIIHRDLKPENIYLIERGGNPDFVKLLDFGIAKMTEVPEGGRKLTRTGMLFGTPEYMAPEQARGESTDQRADIYAMGCILHHLIAGEVPFTGDNFMAILSAHLTAPPPRLAPELLQWVGAPAAMAEVVEVALAKDRDQRYATVAALSEAVRGACGDLLWGLPGVPPAIGNGATGSVSAISGGARSMRPPSAVPNAPTGPHQKYDSGPVAGSGPVAARPVTPTPPASRRGLLVGVGLAALAIAVVAGVVLGRKGEEAPATVRIAVASTPSGASIVDVASGRVLGTTPGEITLARATAPLALRFQLAGHRDHMAEVLPDRDRPLAVTLAAEAVVAPSTPPPAATPAPATAPSEASPPSASAPASPARPRPERRPSTRRPDPAASPAPTVDPPAATVPVATPTPVPSATPTDDGDVEIGKVKPKDPFSQPSP